MAEASSKGDSLIAEAIAKGQQLIEESIAKGDELRAEAELIATEEAEAQATATKVAEDAQTALTKAAITGETKIPVLTPDGKMLDAVVDIPPTTQATAQAPTVQAAVTTQPVIGQTGPALIQDTTFFGQAIDPNSTAGQIAIGASTTPIVVTGDPVADRVNAFLRNTNILLNATGSQSVGGGF